MTQFIPDRQVVSWGRVQRFEHQIARPSFRDELKSLIEVAGHQRLALLPVGLGRSYGDSGLNGGAGLIAMTGLDRLIAFDPATGLLEAEAGASLRQILDFIVPRGWFLPVTPGTQFVTLGGAIANDVHGKNHHRAGTFGRWVREICLLRTDGSAQVLRPGMSLFDATIGGLGLTGIIVAAKLQLKPVSGPQVDSRTIAFGNLREYFTLARQYVDRHEYNVAWTDAGARGRGLYTVADHAEGAGPGPIAPRAPRNLLVELPGSVLNEWTIRVLNTIHFGLGAVRRRPCRRSYAASFYPLDEIGHWNLIYGRRGMYQYQCVLPPNTAEFAAGEMLQAVANSGMSSVLSVLKTFGALQSPGLLSFPREGTTFALDFPNRGARTLALFDRLDAIVREAGGRLYPAKDGTMSPEMFRGGYPRLDAFLAHLDPGLTSTFWRRVGK